MCMPVAFTERIPSADPELPPGKKLVSVAFQRG